MNFAGLTASKCVMRFKEAQKVTGFLRTMLMNVAHKQYVVPLCNRSSAAPGRDVLLHVPDVRNHRRQGGLFRRRLTACR
jgi:hypothetical protein